MSAVTRDPSTSTRECGRLLVKIWEVTLYCVGGRPRNLTISVAVGGGRWGRGALPWGWGVGRIRATFDQPSGPQQERTGAAAAAAAGVVSRTAAAAATAVEGHDVGGH